MANSSEFLDHVRDLFAGYGPVDIRRMFGGAGVFRDGLMFALVSDDTLYFKADERNRPAFEAASMEPFSFQSRGRRMVTSYWACPPDLLEDADGFSQWARAAHDVALTAAAKKGGKKSG